MVHRSRIKKRKKPEEIEIDPLTLIRSILPRNDIRLTKAEMEKARARLRELSKTGKLKK